MNKVCLMGRLTSDPNFRTYNGVLFGDVNIAVDRRLSAERRQQAQTDSSIQRADFPKLTFTGKTAELIQKHFHKGSRIGIEGHIETGKYQDKNGNMVYTTDVRVDNIDFVDQKSDSGSQGGNRQPGYTPQSQPQTPPSAGADGWTTVDDTDDVPFY